ncbi:uncharacterized protein DNG_02796 [Cephalotrichum gorgonifer]|uniref:Methyltransferase domain-containing protein n=1 Tax=Cephalotrichum gorgonifer TaxID=2041049 RepID=A0AAE8MT32_9PEZI|nr:uncharacterized protein DNG_02796 [Cephalotrichum gorgonifer]
MADSLAQAKYSALTWNTPLSEAHATDLLGRLQLSEAKSIVDIGCGWGELLLRAAALAGPDIKATGVDTDQLLLDRGARNALERNIAAEFVQQRGEEFRGTADRAVCIGSSHTLGGTREMLKRLAEVVPRGRVLVGDNCYDSPPAKEVVDVLGEGILTLVEIVQLCRETGWEVLHLSTADQREWDDFESGHRAGPREWLLAHPDDPQAAEVRELHDGREREYLGAYRGVLGLVYLVLGR